MSARKTYIVKDKYHRHNIIVKGGEEEDSGGEEDEYNHKKGYRKQTLPDDDGHLFCHYTRDKKDFFCITTENKAKLETETSSKFYTDDDFVHFTLNATLTIKLAADWMTEWRLSRVHDQVLRYHIPDFKFGTMFNVEVFLTGDAPKLCIQPVPFVRKWNFDIEMEE